MRQDITKYMIDSKEGIDAFFSACDALINGKYILADAKISGLLKCAAASSKVFDLFKRVCDGFSLDDELIMLRSANGLPRLPASDERIAATVFCLLLSFDTGALAIKDFLDSVFLTGADINETYTRFLQVFIVPFKDSVKKLLDGGEAQSEADGLNRLRAQAAEFIASILREITDAVERDAVVSVVEREEISVLARELSGAANANNPLLARALHIGLKNTVKQSKISKSIAALMDELERKMGDLLL